MYTHSMETIYLSLRAQVPVAVGTFFYSYYSAYCIQYTYICKMYNMQTLRIMTFSVIDFSNSAFQTLHFLYFSTLNFFISTFVFFYFYFKFFYIFRFLDFYIFPSQFSSQNKKKCAQKKIKFFLREMST